MQLPTQVIPKDSSKEPKTEKKTGDSLLTLPLLSSRSSKFLKCLVMPVDQEQHCDIPHSQICEWKQGGGMLYENKSRLTGRQV